jgi:predicted nucleotidyltransferase
LSHLDESSKILRSLNVPDHLVDQLTSHLAGVQVVGMLLYGSWARHEAKATSDLDVLVLASTPTKSIHADFVSLSIYTHNQLLSARSTLFGMHLARDGVILSDRSGELRRILALFTPPNPDNLIDRVRRFTAVLDATEAETQKYIAGFCRLARYLLRTAIYAQAIREGEPCFSLQELADRYKDPSLPTVLSSHEGVHPHPSAPVFADLKCRLSDTLGHLAPNRYLSLHALIIGSWNSDRELSHLGLLVLGQDDTLPYAEIPKVIL